MTDERYLFVSDVKEKKNIARSAHNRRTHTGKGGKVMMPSDYLTRKEKAAMNGEVKSYRLNDPMTWKDFKEMPDTLKVDYITLLRNKFDVPNSYIAEMLGVNSAYFNSYLKTIGVETSRRRRSWDKDTFDKWRFGVKTEKNEEDNSVIKKRYDEAPDELMTYKEQAEAVYNISAVCEEEGPGIFEEKICAIPTRGSLNFDCPADDAVRVISSILGNNRVRLSATWEVCD